MAKKIKDFHVCTEFFTSFFKVQMTKIYIPVALFQL